MRISTLVVSLSFLLIIVSGFVLMPSRSHADACPAGTTAITDVTRAAASAAGIPTTVSCWNPSDPHVGQQAGAAKQWLQQHATTNANISCLNTDFAEKLQKLMSAVPGGVPTIRDGYRSPQQQANLPSGSTNAGPCQSYHQYGEAADFNASSQTLLWMRTNAAQYGLAPVSPCAIVTGRTCNGSLYDPGHIQVAGPKTGQCGVCSNMGGNGTLPAPATVTPGADDSPGSAVFCPNGYALFNNQCVLTQQNTQCPQGYLMINNQCTPFSQNQSTVPPPVSQPAATPPATPPAPTNSLVPTVSNTTPGQVASSTSQCTPLYICQSGVMYYQTSSCTLQTYQVCQYGCTGNVCTPPSNATSTASTTPTASNFFDQLTQALSPATTSSILVGTILNTLSGNNTSDQNSMVILNQNITAATTIGNDSGNTGTTKENTASGSSPGTSLENTLVANQTFTSNNANDPTSSDYSSTQKPSLLQGVLTDLQTVLVSILTYLHILQQPTY